MPRNGKTERTQFGAVLKSIRETQHDSQEHFAEQLNVSRSLIGNLETKGIPSQDFVKLLGQRFPKRKKEIIDAARRTYEGRDSTAERGDHDAHSFAALDRLIATNQYETADARIQHELWQEPDDIVVFGLQRRSGHILAMKRQYDDSRSALVEAIELGTKEPSVTEDELLPVWEDLIFSLLNLDNRLAQSAIQDALLRYPTAGSLWHKKGDAHLIEQEYANAYAALTVALQFCKLSADILITRGCVLAEWERPKEAINDLDQALNNPASTLTNLTVARAALAFAYFQLGHEDRASDEFLDIDIDVAGAYAAYLNGIFYAKTSYAMGAQQCFAAALEYDDKDDLGGTWPTLGHKRRRLIEEWLSDLRVNRPLRESKNDKADYKALVLKIDTKQSI
jgi:tetratricopeptide (TPR) repeat protein